LTAILDAAPATDSVTLLTRSDGQPWKENHFNHAFAKWCAPGLSFHGLRKGMSAALADAGASDAEIDSVAYHAAGGGMTRHYRAGADQARLARLAIGRLTGNGSRGGTIRF
jgi:hypothetical protein